MKHAFNTLLKGAAFTVAAAVIAVGGGLVGAQLAPSASQAAAPSPSDGSQPVTESMPVSFTGSTEVDVARAFQQRFRTVSAQTLPVTVEINVVRRVTQSAPSNPLEHFFGNPQGRPGEGRTREFAQRGMGSGVIVRHDGAQAYVLTNNHVAGEADEVEVVLHDGRSYAAELVGTDELMDLALLSFEPQGQVPVARLGDSSALQPGDWVFAVGNPLGFESTVTAGIVSATARAAEAGSGLTGVTDYIQTDAAINRGNSGGALVNLDGEVIGINTWIASNSGGSIGLGFAIPINSARRAIDDFIERGEVAYSWLGVQAGSPSPAVAEALDLPDGASGALVQGVFTGSPAEQAGIRPGDLIVAVDGNEIDGSSALVREVARLTPGSRSEFELIRDGRPMTVALATAQREREVSASDAWPGFAVTPLTEEVKAQLELGARAQGVLVTGVQPGSGAAESGLRAGDILVGVGDSRVGDVADFYRALDTAAEDELRFRVVRNGRELILGFVRDRA